MPGARKTKFYAVLNGRGGPRIYNTLAEYQKATRQYSGASSKSFFSYDDAQRWLAQSGITLLPQEAQPRRKYIDSKTHWQDHRAVPEGSLPKMVDVAVQTTSLSLESETSVTWSIALRAPFSLQQPLAPPLDKIAAHCTPALSLNTHAEPRAAVELSQEQKEVLSLVMSGQNLFFTGAAGTGKSVLLREIILKLKQKLRPDEIAVTATTGIAGVNIGGSTVHSFAGIGLGKEKKEKLAKRIMGSSFKLQKWKSVKVLIVDESRCDLLLFSFLEFDLSEYIAHVVRECPKPFGGIQLVLSGDFFQLPPVPDQSHKHHMSATYAFDAESWPRCVTRTVLLRQVFRQTDDTFINILSSMRMGILSVDQVKQLRELSRKIDYDDGIEPSELYPLRSEVERCNKDRLMALPGPQVVYRSNDRAGHDYRHEPIPQDITETLLNHLVAVPELTLKLGAQVMLIQNIIKGLLVNGSTGKVIAFLTTSEALARKIKIAKAAGNEPSDSPPMRPLNESTFSPKEKWPLVRFVNGEELLCPPMDFTVQGFMGNTEASRLQVPLILAWALSIHKSQGQTLPRVRVNLGRVFEKGQAYVTISRATTIEHLEIAEFNPGVVAAHPRVIQWHNHWLTESEKNSYFVEEMDSEEVISRYFDATLENWTSATDESNDVESIPPSSRPTEMDSES